MYEVCQRCSDRGAGVILPLLLPHLPMKAGRSQDIPDAHTHRCAWRGVNALTRHRIRPWQRGTKGKGGNVSAACVLGEPGTNSDWVPDRPWIGIANSDAPCRHSSRSPTRRTMVTPETHCIMSHRQTAPSRLLYSSVDSSGRRRRPRRPRGRERGAVLLVGMEW